MADFVALPNLPQNIVTRIIVSDECPALTRALSERGIECLHTEPSGLLQQPTARHADMLALHLGGNKVAIAKGQGRLGQRLRALGMEIAFTTELEPEYPRDCALNALIINKIIIAKKNAAKDISEYAAVNNFSLLDTKQGYARCSTAVVSERAFITADSSIKKTLDFLGYDCLLVPAGEIELKGYAYGFTGGTCCKLSSKVFAFTGRITELSYFYQIKEFCSKNNVEVVELTDLPLFDIGGMLPITEA